MQEFNKRKRRMINQNTLAERTIDEVEVLRVSAEQGDVAEQNNIGVFYAVGFGVKKNLTEAAK